MRRAVVKRRQKRGSCCNGDEPSACASREGRAQTAAPSLGPRLTPTRPMRTRPDPIDRHAGLVSFDIPSAFQCYRAALHQVGFGTSSSRTDSMPLSLSSSRVLLELCDPSIPSRETSTGDSRSEYAPPLDSEPRLAAV